MHIGEEILEPFLVSIIKWADYEWFKKLFNLLLFLKVFSLLLLMLFELLFEGDYLSLFLLLEACLGKLVYSLIPIGYFLDEEPVL